MKKHLGKEQILQNIDYYWKTFLKKISYGQNRIATK